MANKKQRIDTTTTTITPQFNDSSTADVTLRLHFDNQFDATSSSDPNIKSETHVYLHSQILTRSKYFSALLSDRWKNQSDGKLYHFTLSVSSLIGTFDYHLTVLELLYRNDLISEIDSVSTAINLLPIALELLFEDFIKACIRFLEAVPWTEDEERMILKLIPFITNEEECKELLSRVSPMKTDVAEDMLHGLILSATHNHVKTAIPKAFVAKLLRDFTCKESVRRVLDKAFEKILKVVKSSLEEYSSPDLRGDQMEFDAIQRVRLHTVMMTGKHLLWLVERMIELKVADTAVREWSEQPTFTGNLQKAFSDDTWRSIMPSLPAVMLRCTSRLATAVASGNILAPRQVRMKLVRDWLPVLIVCRDQIAPMGPNHKALYVELEETFLRIISTLPMSDSQELLQQCLSFSTRNVDDCPHLVAAFTTWFRRANSFSAPN